MGGVIHARAVEEQEAAQRAANAVEVVGNFMEDGLFRGKRRKIDETLGRIRFFNCRKVEGMLKGAITRPSYNTLGIDVRTRVMDDGGSSIDR